MTPPEEDFKFIVRIPRRDEATEVAYQQNLTSYFMRIKNTQLERQARASGRDPVCRLQLYLISILTVYSPTSLPLRMLELPISPHRR
jgi:hypothetical protein